MLKLVWALTVLLVGAMWLPCSGGDLRVTPLFNGERQDINSNGDPALQNTWGGSFNPGNIVSFTRQTSVVRSGSGAYRANLGSILNEGSRFFQTFSSALGATASYRQDRNLTRYDSLQGYVRNDTTEDLTLTLELKDYRDSGSHIAKKSYFIPANGAWEPIVAPLDIGSGWIVTGSPDLSRTFAISFLVDADYGAASGSIYLDDMNLVEEGPAIDVSTAPIETIVERLAHRQFDALWSARNKVSGLIPNTSDDVSVGALNTTTGVVWTLPAAIRRGWVTQAAADAYMGQLVTSLNNNRNQTEYLPTRFLDLVTAAPVESEEESTIDASFIALALHNYKSQPATPMALRDSIDTLENRFDFQAFATAGAYRQAYFQPTGQFGCCTYSGYTHENKVIALAGELVEDPNNHVPLASQWNKDTGRVLESLVNPDQSHLVYSFGTEYRAPFAQALLNLFVDTSNRGADNYPNRNLARNPWQNFVRYEEEVSAYLELFDREHFLQPDAARGAAGYQQYSLYNDFGQENLFMPWSVAFSLMAGAQGAEDALRFLLDNGLGNGLDGPLGLADSAQWTAGAANPTQVPSFADNWNMALSLMAFMEFLEGPDRSSSFFANLPEVRSALDTVFVAGDYDGNGVTDEDDFELWKATYGSRTLLAADGNNDGRISAADFTIWRDNYSAGLGSGNSAVPEPGTMRALSSSFLIWVVSQLTRRSKKNLQTKL